MGTIITKSGGGGSVTSVTGTAPISSTGGVTPNLSMASANGTTNGYLLSSDWLIFNGKFNTPTGTTLQYLRGDGSLATFPAIPAQYNPTAGTGISITGTYPNQTITNSAPDQVVALTAGTGIGVTGTYPNFTVTNSAPSSGGTVTSVAALTLGTTGTDVSSTVATGTTTPVITLNIPTASAANRGALSAADWTTFNSRQAALTLTTTGTSGAATLVGATLNVPQYTTPSTLSLTQLTTGSLIFSPSAAPAYNGEIVKFGTGTLTAGQLYYLNSSGVWTLANASSAADSIGMLGIAVGASPTVDGLLVRGYAVNAGYTQTTGSVIYISTTAGALTATAPSATTQIVRVVGYKTSLADTIYLSPDPTWVTLA